MGVIPLIIAIKVISGLKRNSLEKFKEALIKSEFPAVQGCTAIFIDIESLKM